MYNGGAYNAQSLAALKAALAVLVDPLLYKGAINCSANPNYPAADAGHVYIVSVDGKIGGASGTAVTAGNMVICNTDSTASGDQATVGTKWNIIQSGSDLSAPGAIGGTTAGTIRALLDEDAEPASDTLTANQCSGGLINNYGQDADAVIQLPTIAAGYSFTVILGTTVAKYYRIKAGTNDKIYLDGVAGSDNGYVGVASAAAGNAIAFVAFQTGEGAYDWYASTISGGWVAG